jgi:tetratricopeptide (TPR) repeat protein
MPGKIEYVVVFLILSFAMISCGTGDSETVSSNNEGWKHFNAGRYNEALDCFNIAIALDPNNSSAYTNRAMAKSKLLEYESALVDWETYIKLEKHMYPLHENDYDHAKMMVEKLKTDPKVCFSRAEERLAINNYYGALADFTKAIELDPDFAKAYIARGGTKERLGDFSGAVEDYQEAIRITPGWKSQLQPEWHIVKPPLS